MTWTAENVAVLIAGGVPSLAMIALTILIIRELRSH